MHRADLITIAALGGALVISTLGWSADPGPQPLPQPIPGPPPRALTADDLQNLVICARRAVGNLTPQEMVAIATAIQHAETDAAELRKVDAPTTAKKP